MTDNIDPSFAAIINEQRQFCKQLETVDDIKEVLNKDVMDGTQFVDITELLLNNNEFNQEEYLGEKQGRIFVNESDKITIPADPDAMRESMQASYYQSKNTVDKSIYQRQQQHKEYNSQVSQSTKAHESKTYLKQTLQKHQQEQKHQQDILRDSDLIDNRQQYNRNKYTHGSSDETLHFIKRQQRNTTLPIYQQYYRAGDQKQQQIQTQQILSNLNMFNQNANQSLQQNSHLKREDLTIFNPKNPSVIKPFQFDDLYWKIKNKQQRQAATNLQDVHKQMNKNLTKSPKASRVEEKQGNSQLINKDLQRHSGSINKVVTFKTQECIENKKQKYQSQIESCQEENYKQKENARQSTAFSRKQQKQENHFQQQQSYEYQQQIQEKQEQQHYDIILQQQKVIEALHQMVNDGVHELQVQMQINEDNKSTIQYFKQQIQVLQQKMNDTQHNLRELDESIIDLCGYSDNEEFNKIISNQNENKKKIEVMSRYINRIYDTLQ